MNPDQEFFDQLDHYDAGRLNDAERQNFESRLASDPLLQKKADEHRAFLVSLKSYNKRNALRQSLEQIHAETVQDASPLVTVVTDEPASEGFFRKYWPMIAVAASVAFISITGTLITSHSLEEKQTAYYKELRRNVDQITRSHNRILKDIAESKQKDGTLASKYTGTGFLISSSGYIATSYHVIQGADSVYVQNEQFGSIKAEILYSDPANDLAILKIARKFKPAHSLPFTISAEEASLGEAVYTLGFPREDIVYGEGSVSASTGYRQNENAYQVSVPVNPGNSGGPLMNEHGDVIGIISGIQTETSGAAFAIKSRVLLDVIHEVPDSLKSNFSLPAQHYHRNVAKVQQVKRWKEFVFMVKVYNK